jgi:hypothetical protein
MNIRMVSFRTCHQSSTSRHFLACELIMKCSVARTMVLYVGSVQCTVLYVTIPKVVHSSASEKQLTTEY